MKSRRLLRGYKTSENFTFDFLAASEETTGLLFLPGAFHVRHLTSNISLQCQQEISIL